MTNRIALRSKTPAANLLAAAAIAGSALLGLTACSSDKPAAAGASTTASSSPAVGAPSLSATTQSSQQAQPSQSSPSQPQSPATTTASTTTQASAPAAPKTTQPTAKPTKPAAPKTAAPPAANQPVGCPATQLKATVTNLTRPINHVLLTVTNIGSAPCNLYYYPDLRFDADQQSVTQAVEESKPQAVVTIAPGESGYAAIGTSAADGSGGTGKVEKQVEVFLESRDQSGSLPGSMKLPLPANTYVDDKAFVTYWQSDLQSAIAW